MFRPTGHLAFGFVGSGPADTLVVMTVSRASGVPGSVIYPDGVAGFARIGWSTRDWDDLYDFLTASPQLAAGATVLASWLRHPPAVFVAALTPDQVRDVFARHGKRAGQVLRAMAAGASERFVVAFSGPPWNAMIAPTAVNAWRDAVVVLGLTEKQATGWAATGWLQAPAKTQEESAGLILVWTDRFGSSAYLWPLAGFTLDEATAMRDHKSSPTQDQLRVMVALNGHILPDGV